MGNGRRGIRRGAMVAAALAAVMVPSALAIVQAGAVVTPVGAVTLKLNFTLHETITGTPTAVGPMAGTAHGTVDSAGHLNFPQGGMTFASFNTTTAGQAVTLHLVPTADWTGTIDPTSGSVLLNATGKVLFSVDVLSVVDCPLGPSTWNLFGKGYNSKTGKVALVDPAFDIPALVPGTPGCAGQEATIDGLLPLPAVGSANAGLTFSPILGGVGITATTTTDAPTTTTTTVAPATTATPVTPAANTGGTQLPRTGSSTMPLAFAGATFLLAGLALVVRRKPRTAESS